MKRTRIINGGDTETRSGIGCLWLMIGIAVFWGTVVYYIAQQWRGGQP